MKWNEIRWDEMKWDKMRWNEFVGVVIGLIGAPSEKKWVRMR
jgi:hypothetical protein